jgi:uncharacterized protein (TIGR02391 family)
MREYKRKEPCFSAENLERIAQILADTQFGLTGSQIGHILQKCGIPDVDPKFTKWKRLYNAFANIQNKERCSNAIIAFIHKAMSPVLYTGNQEWFESTRDQLNRVLAFAGYNIGDDGRVKRTKPVSTLTEAEKRAATLKEKLTDRNVHSDVLTFCRAELLQDNYFHAVLEAAKSVAEKIRLKTGLTSDGAKLANEALSLGQSGQPLLAINTLQTDTEKSEQTGFMNLVVGLFGTFRNPTGHAPKIYWPIEEQDALDILSLISLVHRKLDKATIISRKP